MSFKAELHLLAVLALIAVVVDGVPLSSYGRPPPPRQNLNHLDQMITRCFQSICKHWMTECHWFCDDYKGTVNKGRCLECLTPRGQHCLQCFDL